MSNTYTIKNSRGSIITTINETQKDSTSTSLVLQGRGAKEYGFDRNQNLIFFMEHFSNPGSPGGGPSNPIDGQLWWNRTSRRVFVWDTLGSPIIWVSIIPPIGAQGFNVIAGTGLTGGSNPTGSPLTTTLNVGEGTGITITADAVSTNDSEIVHDNLFESVGSPIVFANRHIDHSTIIIVAGEGLLDAGGGDLTASRTLNIGAGDGIIVNADDVAVDSTVVRTFSNQTITGTKTWTTQILGAVSGSPAIGSDPGTANTPSFSFSSDTDTGFYRSGANELSFTTGGTQRFRVESGGVGSPLTGGVLHSLNTSYESLVIHDDDIPNKKYVDDIAPSGTFPTETSFTGFINVTGLTVGKKYLISVYGVAKHRGLGWATLGSVRISQTTVSGAVIAATPSLSIEWPHGQHPVMATFIVTAPSVTIAGAVDYISIADFKIAAQMTAVQLD